MAIQIIRKTLLATFIGIALSTVQALADGTVTPVNDRTTWPEGTPRSDAAVALGKHLFFDPRLVLSENQSCASCHTPHAAYADSVALDLTGRKDWSRAKRNSPTVYNLTDAPVVHWDGRTPAGQCLAAKDTGLETCLAVLSRAATGPHVTTGESFLNLRDTVRCPRPAHHRRQLAGDVISYR
ncbi:MAG: hypothetical protein GY948_05865 [Alphaproteobacteria bacterium]|nr:hypothetical protein [Alphaproteobacteria bacterium]